MCLLCPSIDIFCYWKPSITLSYLLSISFYISFSNSSWFSTFGFFLALSIFENDESLSVILPMKSSFKESFSLDIFEILLMLLLRLLIWSEGVFWRGLAIFSLYLMPCLMSIILLSFLMALLFSWCLCDIMDLFIMLPESFRLFCRLVTFLALF